MTWRYNDGGRSAAGYKGDARDCVVRAIAIATEQPYEDVYKALHTSMLIYRNPRGHKKFCCAGKTNSPRNGVPMSIVREYLPARKWDWHPTMKFGQGCRVHLIASELPPGRLIVRLSRHICAVIDGVIEDTYDPSRKGTRCVYGYWSKSVD